MAFFEQFIPPLFLTLKIHSKIKVILRDVSSGSRSRDGRWGQNGVEGVGLAWGRYGIGFGVGTTRGAMSSGYPCWYGPMRVFCFHRVFSGVRFFVFAI